MTYQGDEIAVCSNRSTRSRGTDQRQMLRSLWQRIKTQSQARHLFATVATTFAIFGVFLVQGIIIARILGPTGRGEFGTAIYFPRDILLYVGLLGAIEIVTGYAARQRCNPLDLRFAAARLGFLTGTITAVAAAVLSISLLVLTQKQYLIPFALFCCLFLPWEHVQLTISSVDRGAGNYRRYNLNRFLFAIAFPALVMLAWITGLSQVTGISWLWLICGIFVVSKVVGLIPTVYDMMPFSSLVRGNVSIRQHVEKHDVPSARVLLREGRPYALSTLVTELFERLDILLILALASITESGFYFVAVPAAALLTVAPNALGVFTFNAGADNKFQVTPGIAAKVMGATALFQIVATVFFALIIDQLIRLFYGEEFAAAVPFALWLLPASAIKGFLQAADGYLKGRQKPMIGVWSRGLSISVMLVFVAIAYGPFGLIAVPMAACVGQAVSLVVIVTAIFVDVSKPKNLSNHAERSDR